jgi:hypothetical protein
MTRQGKHVKRSPDFKIVVIIKEIENLDVMPL